jgi:hypothetical protein
MLGSSQERPLSLDLTVDLMREEPPGHPRHTTGEYAFNQRMLLHAYDTRGEPLVRVATIPLQVKVSTAAEYYFVYGIIAAVGLGLLILAIVMWRKAAGPRQPRRPATATTDPMAHLDDDDGFFSSKAPAPVSGGASTQRGSDAEMSPAKNNASAEPEPPPHDDDSGKPDLWD